MPQQPATSFADDLAKARAAFEADLAKAREPKPQEPAPMSGQSMSGMASLRDAPEVSRGATGRRALQVALAVGLPASVPIQAATQGALGAVDGGLQQGVIDAALGAGGAALKFVKPMARVMWSKAAGSESVQAAEDILKRGLGRLIPTNTGKMAEEAAKVQEWVPTVPRNAAGKIVPGPRIAPSGPSPLQPAVDAHRVGVDRAGGALNLPMNTLGAAVKLATHPGARANVAQTAYRAAQGKPEAWANALRLALSAALGGS